PHRAPHHTDLAAQYRRLVRRRGDKKAIVAVAHSILVIAYHVLRDSQSYRELGGDYFDRLSTDRLTRYHTKRLAALGYAVTLTKCAACRCRPPSYVRSAFVAPIHRDRPRAASTRRSPRASRARPSRGIWRSPAALRRRARRRSDRRKRG